jgi:hypothetical protein
MTALHIEPFEPICRLDPPICRRTLTAAPPHDHSAESGASPAPGDLPRPHGGLDLSPVSAYEIVTRQMIEATQRDVAEIKGRINNLMVMVCGAVLVNIVLRMAGLG